MFEQSTELSFNQIAIMASIWMYNGASGIIEHSEDSPGKRKRELHQLCFNIT